MEIRNRIFPYPVLNEDTDDYIGSSFSGSVEFEQELNELRFHFRFNLEDPGMQKLINKGDAYFAVHFECSKTAYRRLLKTQQTAMSFSISVSKLNGDIALIAAVIAARDIPYYKNLNLNEDYKDSELFIPKGAFMAYETLPKIRINKNYEELATTESMFSIVQKKNMDGEDKPVEFELGMDKIKLIVDEKMYRSYLMYSMNDGTQEILWSLLLLPAIIHMIDRIQADGVETYENADWYMRMSKQYQMQGLDLEEILMDPERPIMQTAQEILKMPLNKALTDLGTMMGSEDE